LHSHNPIAYHKTPERQNADDTDWHGYDFFVFVSFSSNKSKIIFKVISENPRHPRSIY